MTDDWADKAADELVGATILQGEVVRGSLPTRIAAALRKAKADGLREAAYLADKEWFTAYDEYAKASARLAGFEVKLRSRATQTEKGE